VAIAPDRRFRPQYQKSCLHSIGYLIILLAPFTADK
jgi:hypothetical protein